MQCQIVNILFMYRIFHAFPNKLIQILKRDVLYHLWIMADIRDIWLFRAENQYGL